MITPSEFAQQIKAAISIENVIGDYLTDLTRRGMSLKACCPFHHEKTPSFFVHPEQGFYHCFGCGAHGDLLKFIQEIEKIDFMEALTLLANKAGISVPSFSSTSETDIQAQLRTQLIQLCAWAEKFYINQIHEPHGEIARAYLINRGLDDETIRYYHLGYAPEAWDALTKTAQRQGWTAELLTQAGLSSRLDNGNLIDRFRNRIIFPISDRTGITIAFAGRTLSTDPQTPKYLNSTETLLFKKSSLLYGYAAAREAIKSESCAILVEGYMDWLALHRHGIRNVLAGMGTALTEGQVRLVKKITQKVILLYDADAAGEKALFKATEMLLNEDFTTHAAIIPSGEDPDSYLKAHGVQSIRDILTHSPHAANYHFEKTAARLMPFTPEKRAEAIGQITPLLLAIKNPVLREGYMQKAATIFGLRLETIESAISQHTSKQSVPSIQSLKNDPIDAKLSAFEYSQESSIDNSVKKSEQILLNIIFEARNDAWSLLEKVDEAWFVNEHARSLFADWHKTVAEGGELSLDIFDNHWNEAERNYLSEVIFASSRLYQGELTRELFRAQSKEAFAFHCMRLKRYWLQRQKEILLRDMNLVLSESPDNDTKLDAIEELHRERERDFIAFRQSIQPQPLK